MEICDGSASSLSIAIDDDVDRNIQQLQMKKLSESEIEKELMALILED